MVVIIDVVQDTKVWYDCMSMGGMRFFPLLIMLLVVYFIYSFFKKDKYNKNINTDLDTLNNRYARGEINKDEYDTIKRDIT